MMTRFYSLMSFLLLLVLGSCTGDVVEEVMTADGRYEYVLDLQGGVTEYADGTRAAKVWQNGDVVYLRFSASGGTTQGTATYQSGQWTLTTTSPLSGSGTCQAVSVSNAAGSVSGNTLPLNSASAVYEDKQGTWSRSGNTLTVRATLNPVLGRLRFKGSSGTSFSLTGLTTYTSYNLSTGTFATSQSAVSGSIGSSGYSGYIHGLMASSTSPTLQTNGYTMECPSTMMQAGECGWLNYPTSSSHTGWTKEGGDEPAGAATRTFTANGVSFTMVLVEKGTFTMGATPEQEDPYDDEKPAHQVTLTSDYYMGETEVTQALWQAVTGSSPTTDGDQWSSSYGLGASYPAYNISWNDVQSFLTKLNSLTGQQFRMPTEAEWEYAARGGKKSQGYQYSGGNTIGDVAWYNGNSGSKTHEVKTKQANELGLYDMSGNVWEWCADWYSDYTSAAVTDPTGPTSGSNRVRRGGRWVSGAGNCRVAYRDYFSPSYRSIYLGFRLAL